MVDFEKITDECERAREISASVIDNFLIYYAAAKNKLNTAFDLLVKPYTHIIREGPPGWSASLKSQFICHKIFKKGGLIHPYLNHSDIKVLKQEELDYLKKQSERPWRFSFSFITDHPWEDFYRMEDVFTDETYLLYSPGTKEIIQETHPVLWLNLIGFNGYCWQSFGPINGYQSFDADDIFFFATELHPEIENEDMLINDIERNPIPYMMLLIGSRQPDIYNKKDRITFNVSECDYLPFQSEPMKGEFEITYEKGIGRMCPKRWSGFPHFARVYFDEKKSIILLIAMTDKGYFNLVDKLKLYGITAPELADIRVSFQMISVTEGILKKKIKLDPYENIFEKPAPPDKKENLDKINNAIQLMLPDLNAGRTPDFESIAGKTGEDTENLKAVFKHIQTSIQNTKKGR